MDSKEIHKEKKYWENLSFIEKEKE